MKGHPPGSRVGQSPIAETKADRANKSVCGDHDVKAGTASHLIRHALSLERAPSTPASRHDRAPSAAEAGGCVSGAAEKRLATWGVGVAGLPREAASRISPNDLKRLHLSVERGHCGEAGGVGYLEDRHRWPVCQFDGRLARRELTALPDDNLAHDVQEGVTNVGREPRHHHLRVTMRGQTHGVRQAL